MIAESDIKALTYDVSPSNSEEKEQKGGEDEGCHSQAERKITHNQAGYSGVVCFYRKPELSYRTFYRKFGKRAAKGEIGRDFS